MNSVFLQDDFDNAVEYGKVWDMRVILNEYLHGGQMEADDWWDELYESLEVSWRVNYHTWHFIFHRDFTEEIGELLEEGI